MGADNREIVRQRAGNCCEYCRLPQQATPFIPFHVEHIVARQHVDGDHNDPSGLAYACDRCNVFKGPKLSSIDPESGDKVDLFNPRTDVWPDHFMLSGGSIIGLTATGRATARLLKMNDSRRVDLREQWLDEGESL